MGTYSEKNVVQALIVLMNVIAGDLSLISVRPSVRPSVCFWGLICRPGVLDGEWYSEGETALQPT